MSTILYADLPGSLVVTSLLDTDVWLADSFRLPANTVTTITLSDFAGSARSDVYMALHNLSIAGSVTTVPATADLADPRLSENSSPDPVSGIGPPGPAGPPGPPGPPVQPDADLIIKTLTALTAATNDALVISGRAGGIGSFKTTLRPAALTANRVIDLPNKSGTVALLDDIIASTFDPHSPGPLGDVTPDTVTSTKVTSITDAGHDAVVISGRTGGVGSFKVTIKPTTLTSSYVQLLPDKAGTFAMLSDVGAADWANPGTIGSGTPNTGVFTSLTSITAATQDAVVVLGRAGGVGSFKITISPTTLDNSYTQILPSKAGTFAMTADLIGGSWASPAAAIGTGTPVAITGSTLAATGVATNSVTTAGGYTSTVAIGTAPFTATSTTVCPNLHAANSDALAGGTWASPAAAIGTGAAVAVTATTLAATAAGGLTLGTDVAGGSPNIAGFLKMWSAGDNAFFTSFTTGTQGASLAYTLPTAFVAGGALTDVAGNGVLSWTVPGGGITGALTATRIPVASGAGTVVDYSTFTTDGTTLTINGLTLGRGGAYPHGLVLGNATIGSDYATAIGDRAAVTSSGGIAIGTTASSANGGISIGEQSAATAAYYGIGIGFQAASLHNGSIAIGFQCATSKSHQVVLGASTVTEVYIPGTTDATTPTAAQLYVAGGVGASRIRTTNDSYFNGVRVGLGGGSDSVVVGETGMGASSQSVAAGTFALNATTGEKCVGIGRSALVNNVAGSHHVAVGWSSGSSQNGGSGCTYVGFNCGTTLATASNSMALGNAASISASNQIVLGDTNVTELKSVATFHPTAGSAAAVSALSFGLSLAEGLQLKVIEETVDFGTSPGKSINLTTAIPAGAVVVSVKSTTKTAITAGGTSVKVGLGPVATPGKYGATADLTINQKITTLNDWIVNAGETIAVTMLATDGVTLGDSNATVGTVRVRIEYWLANNLDN